MKLLTVNSCSIPSLICCDLNLYLLKCSQSQQDNFDHSTAIVHLHSLLIPKKRLHKLTQIDWWQVMKRYCMSAATMPNETIAGP